MQACILEFMQQYPDVAIDYLQHSPSQLRRELEEHRIDVAFTNSPIHSEEIEWQEGIHGKTGVLIAADHPLAQKGSAEGSRLAQ